jgi:hypothetical protein
MNGRHRHIAVGRRRCQIAAIMDGEWQENGAWLRMFQNARKWVG